MGRKSGPAARRALLALGAWALAQDPAGASSAALARKAEMREVQGAERRLEHALVQADAPATGRLLTDDFLGVGPDGRTYARGDVLKALRGPSPTAVEAAGELRVRLYAGAAVVQGRGRGVGLAPQAPPGERVFTDTWVQTRGRWRMAASEALGPGAQTPALYASDRAEILALRSASNGFIAAHDLSRFTPMFADDAVFVWSDGSSAVGKAGLSARFAKEFADPAFVTLVRTPRAVAVSELGARAVEHGAWTAFRRDARGETVAGGDYAAHWVRVGPSWKVKGELYVKLRCAGPLCSP